MKDKSKKSTYSTTFGVDPSTYSTTFGVDPKSPTLAFTLLRVEITKAPALFAKKNAAKTASISGAP